MVLACVLGTYLCAIGARSIDRSIHPVASVLVCKAICESKRMEVNAQRKECHILGLCFAGCVSILSREFGLFCTGGPVVFIVVGTMRTFATLAFACGRSLLFHSSPQGLCSFVFSFLRMSFCGFLFLCYFL
jgi:hypothetical protein